MPFAHHACAALALATTATLLSAAKPAPTPTPSNFIPALSYRYNGQELRLANADGSQAVLLVRMPLGPDMSGSVYDHALAPLGQGRAAFVYAPNATSRELRLVSWSQPTPGGPLAVTLDPIPLFTVAGGLGTNISSIDFSPDGTRLAAVSHNDGQNNELRVFDVATRTQISDAIQLAEFAQWVRWRSFDDSLLLRGSTGLSSVKDGVQSLLFTEPQGLPFDTFNGASPEAALRFHDARGNTIQRWDGITVNGGQAAFVQLVPNGIDPSISCDNSRMIYTRLGSRTTISIRTLASGGEHEFSRDRGITFPAYPNGCG